MSPLDLDVVTFPSPTELARRLPRLLVGIVALSGGVALLVQARLGVDAYDVLHQGLAQLTGMSFGTVVVLVGLAVLILWIPIGQRLGLGTVLNVLLVGPLVDVTLRTIPTPEALAWRWPMLLAGILLVALGTGLYIGAGLGPGPRDGLMTGLAARGRPLWAVRMALELSALAVGWALGGDVGVGTVLFAFSIGPLTHWFLAHLHLGVGVDRPDLAARGAV